MCVRVFVCHQYFLDYGLATAEVDGRVVNTFTAGDFFGEVSFVATAAGLLEGEKVCTAHYV